MSVIINHKLSTVTIARTIKHHLAHPVKAFRRERREWQVYFAGRSLARTGVTKHFVKHRRPSGAYAPEWADLWNIYINQRATS